MKCVRGYDGFGHEIKVNYKGEETYNSAFGGAISLVVYALTLVLIVKSAQELYLMEDPVLAAFTKPIALEERADLVPLLHEDYGFVLGVSIEAIDNITGAKVSIPPEMGRWRIVNLVKNKGDEYGDEYLEEADLVDCRDVIDEEIVATTNSKIAEQYAAGVTMCMDPKNTKWS